MRLQLPGECGVSMHLKKKIFDRDFLKKKSIKTGSIHFLMPIKKLEIIIK